MGIEFIQATPEERAAVERLLGVLTENRTLLPELLVEPEGLEPSQDRGELRSADMDDPLLQLFNGEVLTADQFHEAMRKQRAMPVPVGADASALA
jgi:hypothetical protein